LVEALLRALEASPPGAWMRGAGVWTYAIANLTHILGIATLFGAVLALDLRLMGLWRGVPLRHVETVAVPLSVAGFAIAATSGAAMLAVNATEYAGNPFLAVKFGAIALAVLNVLLATRLRCWHRRHLADSEPRPLRIIGALSLACWLIAISSGRMLGYW
jgi:hypothetical protein